jgi:hypothetical protein
MIVDMFLEPRTRHLPQVETDVVTVGLHNLVVNLDRPADPCAQGRADLVGKFEVIPYMKEGSDEKMTRIVGITVENKQDRIGSMDEEGVPLIPGGAEKTSLPLRGKDILHPPRCPEGCENWV